MTKAKKQVAQTVELVKNYNVTAQNIADRLNIHAKSLRRKLRAETRDASTDTMHKVITRKTRYAFTQDEADAIVARFSTKHDEAKQA